MAGIGMILVIILCSFLGFLCYAKYAGCDPIEAGIVTSADQLLPLFVMDALRDYPVLPGLLIAGITCGSLSTVSSALNSLTALLTEDFLKYYRPDWDEFKLGLSSKIISTATGIIAFGLVFIVKIANESIQISPFSTLIHGSLLGPILGAFSLGMFLPWANNGGILLGMGTSILFSGFIGLGNILAGRQDLLPNMRLDLTLRECPCQYQNGTLLEAECKAFVDPENWSLLDLPHNEHWKDNGDSFWIKVWSTSYIWQPGIGGLATVIFGTIFSFIIIACRKKQEKVHVKLLSKPFLRLWKKIFGEERLNEWVDYDEKVLFGKEKEAMEMKDMNMISIPKAKLAPLDSPYAHG